MNKYIFENPDNKNIFWNAEDNKWFHLAELGIHDGRSGKIKDGYGTHAPKNEIVVETAVTMVYYRKRNETALWMAFQDLGWQGILTGKWTGSEWEAAVDFANYQ